LGDDIVTEILLHQSRANTVQSAKAAALALLALTTVHHVYAAVAFGTPWRLHVLVIVVPAAIAIFLTLSARMATAGQSAGRGRTVFAAVVIFLVPVGTIGFYEGGYNHLLKNLVYFVGGEAPALARFPPPTYEMPSDIVFEATGIAQFPLYVVTAVLTVRLLGGAAR
jgi:hypothetical protein